MRAEMFSEGQELRVELSGAPERGEGPGSAPPSGPLRLRAVRRWIAPLVGLTVLGAIALGLPQLEPGDEKAERILPLVVRGAWVLAGWSAIGLAWALLRRARFGRPELRSERGAPRRGEACLLELHSPRRLRFEGVLRATLSCMETVVRRSGSGERSTSLKLRWQDTLFLTDEALRHGPAGTAATLRFEPPSDAPETGQQVRWVLCLDAPCSGPDFKARFTLPVHGTAPDPEPDAEAAPLAPLPGQLAPHEILSRSRLRLHETERGVEVHTPALASPKSAIAIGVLAAMFGGATGLLQVAGGPLLLRGGFGLVAALLIVATLHELLARGRVRIERGLLEFAHGVPGLQREGRIEAGDFESIELKPGDCVGETQLYDLLCSTRAGERIKIARSLPERATARALADAVEFELRRSAGELGRAA